MRSQRARATQSAYMDSFKFNIIGCIEQYQDFQGAIKWLEKGKREASDENFIQLIRDVFSHFLRRHQFSNAEKFLNFDLIPTALCDDLQNTYSAELYRCKKNWLQTNSSGYLIAANLQRRRYFYE